MNFLLTSGRRGFALLCSLVCLVGLADAQLSVGITATDPSCAGFTDGSLLAEGAGGAAPYTYTWSSGQTSAGLYGLSGGSYTVTVRDLTGATATATAQVSAPAALSLTIDVNGDVCDLGSATLNLAVAGGTAPYTYTWDGAASGATVTNASPGYHYAQVTDANGCSAGAGISVAAPLSVNVRTDNVVCNGFCDGTVEAQIAGGTGPYTFAWSNGATDQIVYGLDPGTYTVVVTDANGCTATGSGSLTEPDAITFEVSLQDSCAGATQASVVAQGGTGALTIRWSTGTIGASAFLPEGQHYVYVTDENGCEESDVVIVSDGIESVVTMNVDATCDEPGRSLLCITGGRGPFTYIWSDGQSTIEATDLAPGTYSYTIIDGGGCRFDGSTVINGPDPSDCTGCDAEAGTLTGGTTTDELCAPPITLTATVATAPTVPAGYQVLYVLTTAPNATIQAASPTPSFDVGAPGNYTIHTLVYDPNTLPLGGVVFGQTMAADIFLQITAGGGSVCAALDLTGTTFTVPECSSDCEADAGTLTGGITTGEACDSTITLTATVDVAPNVPNGYQVLYVVTTDPNATIVAVGQSPSFDVDTAGTYTIHTLVYDPATLALGGVVLGQTTAAQVFSLLIDGGGSICAALDLTGTTFIVPECSDPLGCDGGSAAQLTSQPVCFDGTTTTLAPGTVTGQQIPAGYELVYVLSAMPGDTIVATSADSLFDVTSAGTYTIRALVYNPDSLDLATAIVLGQTTTTGLGDALTECDDISAEAATFEVTLFDPAFDDAMGADAICPGEMTELNPGGADSLTYSWTPADLLDDPTAASPMATLDETTTFTVEISQTVGGNTCTAVRTVTAEVAAFPSVTVPADVVTCQGETVDILATTEAGNTVVWSDDPDFDNVLATDSLFTVESGAPTTYYVQVTNAAGCSTSASLEVGDFPVAVELGDDYTVCRGDAAMIDAAITSGSGDQFELFDGAGNSLGTSTDGAFEFDPSNSDTYSVVASNAEGCTSTAEITIDVSSVDVQLLAGMRMDTAIYPGNEVDLTASSNGATSFSFVEDDSYVSVADSTARVLPEETTTYSVEVVNEFGCVDTAQLTVEILEFACERPFLFVPNAFSPDDDGINDVFYIDGVNVEEAYYTIYNRWGEQVFESSVIGPEEGWDGFFNDQLVDPDVYGIYVRVICRDGGEFYTQGNVTVFR